MNPIQQHLLDELNQLARQQNWPDLAQRAEKLLDPIYQAQVCVVTLDSGQVTPFKDWLTDGIQTDSVTTISSAEAYVHPTIQSVNRLVIYLPVGYRISDSDMESLASFALTRPPKTYAIVMALTDPLMDEAELRDVDDRLRRLFVSRLFGAGYMAPPSDANCFIWSISEQPSEKVTHRIKVDGDLLLQWLAVSSQSAVDLTNYQLHQWVSDAEQKLLPTLKETNDEELELNDLIVTINELRAKVIRRLSEAQTDIGRELVASLRAFEQTTKQVWRNELMQPGHKPSATEAVSRLHQITDNQWKEWYKGLRLNERLDQILGEATDPIKYPDWPRINSLLADQPDALQYPEAFAFENSRLEQLRDWANQTNDEMETDPQKQLPKYLRQTALTGVVIAGVGFLFGAVAPALLAGGLTASLLYWRNRQDLHEHLVEAGGQVISRFSRDKIREVSRRLPDLFDPIEQHFNQRFRELRNALEAQIEKYQTSNHLDGESERIIREQLKSIRQQLN